MPALPAEVIRSWKHIVLPETVPTRLYFDGSCPINPGPMGIGYSLSTESGTSIARVGAAIRDGTNNIAEYEALLAGLRYSLRHGWWNLREVVGDSALVTNQINGVWKVRDSRLAKLRGEAVALASLFPRPPKFIHVFRDSNGIADQLSRTLEYEEKHPLPAPISNTGRGLHPWQAQAVRHFWHAKGLRAPEMLGRIAGLPSQAVLELVKGESYQDVGGFTGLPSYLTQLDPQQGLLF